MAAAACRYQLDLVEELVRHLPADGGAVGGFCEEPPGPGSSGDSWRQTHEDFVYRNMYAGYAVECRGWLMGWGGIAYRASSFNDTLLSFQASIPSGCFFHDDVWLSEAQGPPAYSTPPSAAYGHLPLDVG